MTFQEKLADYVLGNVKESQFPDIALTALRQGIESESLLILADMSELDNMFELQHYFDGSLKELGVTFPNKFTAAKILLLYYLGEMIVHPENAFEVMRNIDKNIYNRVDWVKELGITEKKFLGEELGIEWLFTWYRELQDFEDNGMLLYFNDLPRDKQREKFLEQLVEEAKVLKSKFEQEISANQTP